MDSTAYLESQLVEHITWNDLVPAVPLSKLVEKGKKFHIVYCAPDTFNTFNVIETEAHQDDLFHLREEIFEVVDAKDLKLKDDPCVGEIVLAPNPHHKDEYQRALIQNIHFEIENSWKLDSQPADSIATVYFFDMGGYSKVKFKDMKPVTKLVMQFPVLSYKIALYNENTRHLVSGDGLILSNKCLNVLDKMNKVEFRISLNVLESAPHKSFMTDQSSADSSNPVSISYLEKGKPFSLAAKLEQLKVWEWEKVLAGCTSKLDDNTIIKNGIFGNIERNIDAYQLNRGTNFSAQVTRVTESKSSTRQCAEIRVILLSDQVHTNYWTVLHNQIDRYTQLVAKSMYNPALKDIFLFKLDDKEEYSKKGLKRLGKWCRAIKLDIEWIYLLDWDENIPLNGLDSDDYDMRPLYGEFLQVPALVLTIRPLENDTPMTYKRALTLFKPGQRYKFEILRAPPETNIHEAEYCGFTEERDSRDDSKVMLSSKPRRRLDDSDTTTSSSSSSSDEN